MSRKVRNCRPHEQHSTIYYPLVYTCKSHVLFNGGSYCCVGNKMFVKSTSLENIVENSIQVFFSVLMPYNLKLDTAKRSCQRVQPERFTEENVL